jgi:hypothetical protein
MNAETQISILLKGIDNASAPIKEAMDKIDGKLDTCQKASGKVEKSSKDMALAFNNVATSGIALYSSIDRIQTAQVALDKAHLAVKTSANAVEDAQRKYNATIEKFGVGSQEATIASDDLKLAQERYQVACSRAELAQGNVSQAMMSAAITVIPSLITMITSVSTITQAWTAVTALAGQALLFLQMNPIVLVIAGIIALVAVLVIAYQKCEWFRNGVNAIGSGIYDFFVPPVKAAKKSIEELTKALKEGIGANLAFVEAERFAKTYYQQVRAAQEKMAAAVAKLTGDLEMSWGKQAAAADKSLNTIKTKFDLAFNAQNFKAAAAIVEDFANKYGLALGDAEKIIDSFTSKVEEVPKTFEEQLIDKAQKGLETFKNCVSGKFATIESNSSEAWSTLVQDTNDLISRGLVGQAQDNIKAFVDCATDKQSKMVSDIDGYLEEMYKNYDENTGKIQELLKWRLALTWGQPGSDILAAIKLAGGGAAGVATPNPREAVIGGAGGMTRGDLGSLMQPQSPIDIYIPQSEPTVVVEINAPLVNVNGAADLQTARLCAQLIKDALKRVVIEASTSSAGTTDKRIRIESSIIGSPINAVKPNFPKLMYGGHGYTQ